MIHPTTIKTFAVTAAVILGIASIEIRTGVAFSALTLVFGYILITLIVLHFAPKLKLSPALTGVLLALIGVTAMIVLKGLALHFGWVK